MDCLKRSSFAVKLGDMGVFLPELELDKGENAVWEAWANHVRRSVAVGGVLAVTDQRLFFQPNRIERWFRRKTWNCPRDSVVGCEAIARNWKAVLGGGVRRRLAIRTTTGIEVFVVSDVDRRLAELGEVLA
ncbi:MAG: hypothetical protein JST53_01615 [Actinobacteria bacterium]|nr:hypothetical protein [Actinomycetota bacterium]